MKTKINLLAILIILTTSVLAQNQPFRKCNTIEVVNGNLIEFIKFAQSKGYVVANYDKDLEIYKSEPFKLWKSSNHVAVIMAYKENDNLIITGTASVSFMLTGANTVGKMEKRGIGNMFGKAFDIINNLSVKYANKYGYELKYLKK